MNSCIRFNLYDIDSETTLESLINEIKMSFFHRAKCIIQTEDYKRSFKNMFVIIEVVGEEEKINDAIKETEFVFKKRCEICDWEKWDS